MTLFQSDRLELPGQRRVETCQYRTPSLEFSDEDSAVCRLLEQVTGFASEFCQVNKEACTACCESPWPCTHDSNAVISSLICESANRVIQHPASDPAAISRAKRLRNTSIKRLELLPLNPNGSIRPARTEYDCCYRGERIEDGEAEGIHECQHPHHQRASEEICRSCRDWAVAPIPKRLSLSEMVPLPKKRFGGKVSQWAVGVTTSPRREATLDTCIESLRRAGWEQPRLFVDAGAQVSAELQSFVETWHARRLGAWPNFLLSLSELVLRSPDADAFMMVQDDAYFYDADNLREYMESVLWPAETPGIVSLYSTDANDARFAGWHADSYRWLNGGLAFIFSADAAIRFLTDSNILSFRKLNPVGGTVNLDLLIGRWAEKERIPIMYPVPSLVQHFGNTTTIWTGEDNSDLRRARIFAGDLETTFRAGGNLAEFPEQEFPASEELQSSYAKSVHDGRKQMEQFTVTIAGLCRDVRNWLPRSAARIERLGEMFRDYRVVLFENDSEDRTLEFLEDWRAKNPRVRVLSEKLGRKRFPQERCLERTASLAEYRNAYRDVIVQEYRDMDYVIVADMDLPGGWSFDGIASTFARTDWDVVGSNGILRVAVPSNPPISKWVHFDSWAFRAAGCPHAEDNRDAGDHIFRRGEPFVPVWSSFGGLGIYRMECFQAARYSGEDCEHVCFHAALQKFGFNRMFLNPSQIVVY